MRICTSPFHWSFAKAHLVFGAVCPELCILYCGSLFRALFLTRDIRESSEVVPVIVDLLLNQTACGYNIIEETKRILRRGSKVIFLFHHWVRIRQTKTNFNRQFSPKQPEVGQIFILRSNFGQNKDHMTCKKVRVPLKTDIQQVRGPSKLTSSKLGGPQIKWWSKFATNASGGHICKQIKYMVPLKSISNFSSWNVYSSYGLNALDPLCFWQCSLVSWLHIKNLATWWCNLNW